MLLCIKITAAAIHISVYEDKIYIWNDGEMPEDLNSTDKLFMKHSSKPYNPKLANAFFMSGMIEAWGRGFDKIKEACARYEGPLPEYDIKKSGIMVLCKACDRYLDLLHDKSHPVQSEQDDEQDIVKAIITFCSEPKSAKEIVKKFAFPNRLYLKRHFLDEMLTNKQLKMTLPDKPSSKNQKYYS